MVNYRFKDDVPCKGCEKRHPACHSHCQDYIEWLEVIEKEKELFWEKERGNCSHARLVADHKNRFIKSKINRK